MTPTPQQLAQKLQTAHPHQLTGPTQFRGEHTLHLNNPQHITQICHHAKTQLHYTYLVDITSIDNYGTDPRFQIIYHLYTYQHRAHLRITTNLHEQNPTIPTTTPIWRAADWHEREIYDMMGIHFQNHPNLKRILMWEGYPHHPLRKDFPLAGTHTHQPHTAFTNPAPQQGGPFHTTPGAPNTTQAEPKAQPTPPTNQTNHNH